MLSGVEARQLSMVLHNYTANIFPENVGSSTPIVMLSGVEARQLSMVLHNYTANIFLKMSGLRLRSD